MYPYQHDAERRMTEYANRLRDAGTGGYRETVSDRPASPRLLVSASESLVTRLLNQMARELLLAQSSDWAFQIYQGTTVEYSSRRFQSHIQRFDLIAKMLDKLADGLALSPEDLELLAEIENRDNVFQEIDYRVYQS
jgi:1,4-alpha-glucan branching enzyme